MEARFRIRTRDGEELEPRTMEIFAEFVRSGAVRPEDLVHDALTDEWIPAGTHPMVRLMLDPLVTDWDVVDESAATGSEATPADATPSDAAASDPSASDVRPSDPILDGALELVEAPEVSPEEEARAFIARMEDERRADTDEPALSREVALVTEGAAAPAVPTPEPTTAPEPDEESVAAAVREAEPEAEPRVEARRARPARPVPVPAVLSDQGDDTRSWRRVGVIGLAAALSFSSLAIFAVVARPSGRVGDRMPDLAESASAKRMPRHLDNTEEAVRGAAYDAFLGSVDDLRRSLDVGPVPPSWLTGRYLSDPGAYPDVRRYWERYMSYVEHARADEASLYREAYLRALDAAGATGPVRSLRLATALGDFGAGDQLRSERYARAWDLAAAALALHDTLVGLEGRISYEPARGTKVSADPVVEAVGKDADAQVRLDAALDRVLKALQLDEGTIDPDYIPGWLARGLREEQGAIPRRP